MKTRKICLIPAVLAGFLLMVIGLPVWATDYDELQDFNELDLESLLNQTIVTASKHEQKLSETPVAATVITAEEIAARGIRSIPEILRLVPGLDVVQASSSDYDVSARGMNKPGSNAMLVLVDGRSVYEDFYGMTTWDRLSVNVDDIKVIEVIKGPGSVMHGANAFAGVINIITFSPDDKPGTSGRTMISNLSESLGSLRHAGRKNELSWKLTTQWDRSDDWETNNEDSEVARFTGDLIYDVGEASSVSVSGGLVNAETKLTALDKQRIIDGHNSFARADFRSGDFLVRWYMNQSEVDFDPLEDDSEGPSAHLETRMHDLELQHSFSPGSDHFLLWGGSFRLRATDYSGVTPSADESIYAAFIQEEWTPHRKLHFSLGLRYENNPTTGGKLSPRGGLVYKPNLDHSLRVSYSQAYRNPSYMESFWHIENELMPGMVQVIRGEETNKSESIQSFELGYQGMLTQDVLVGVSAFHNNIEDLISLQILDYFPAAPEFPMIPSEMAFVNGESWTADGGELTLQADPYSWLRLSGAYSYVWVEDKETKEPQSQVPAHHAHAVAALRLARDHQLQLVGRYRSGAQWEDGTFGIESNVISQERFFVDLAWSVQVKGGHRFTLAAENIFDKRVRDYPLAIEQRRRVLMSVAVEF